MGAAVALALASLEGSASAGATVQLTRSTSVSGGTARGGMTLAKAKKHKRPGGSSGAGKSDAGKSDPGDDTGDDDSGGKSAAASSDSSDSAPNEDELLGSKKKAAPKPAAKPIARDDSDDAGGDDESAPKKVAKPAKSTKSVETVEASASEEPSEASVSSALEFGVGGKALFRSLNWTADARAAMLGPYSLTPGPETGLWLEFYPAALGTSGFAANVGLFGRFDYGFGVATTLANGMDAATKFRDFLGGIKVRIPVGTFTPNVSVAYGQQVFEVAQQQTPTDLPQLAYQFVRPALGARVIFTPIVAMDIVAGYLLVLDPGSGADHIKSSRYFPKAAAYGIDASASVAVKITGAVGARAGVDWRQYGLNLNPDSTTRSVAGAVDRYITAWAGVEVVLDGQGAAAGGDDEPAKPSKRSSRRRHAKSDDESESEDSSKSEDE